MGSSSVHRQTPTIPSPAEFPEGHHHPIIFSSLVESFECSFPSHLQLTPEGAPVLLSSLNTRLCGRHLRLLQQLPAYLPPSPEASGAPTPNCGKHQHRAAVDTGRTYVAFPNSGDHLTTTMPFTPFPSCNVQTYR